MSACGPQRLHPLFSGVRRLSLGCITNPNGVRVPCEPPSSARIQRLWAVHAFSPVCERLAQRSSQMVELLINMATFLSSSPTAHFTSTHAHNMGAAPPDRHQLSQSRL